MPLYEHVFLTRQDASTQQVEELTTQLKGVIEQMGGKVPEIERQERLNEDVLRYITIRVDEHEDGPSAMMRKADRDRERDDRGFGFRDRERGGFRDRERGDHRRDRDREREGRPPREGDEEESSPAGAIEE